MVTVAVPCSPGHGGQARGGVDQCVVWSSVWCGVEQGVVWCGVEQGVVTYAEERLHRGEHGESGEEADLVVCCVFGFTDTTAIAYQLYPYERHRHP